jgi:hypothetical protein
LLDRLARGKEICGPFRGALNENDVRAAGRH